MAWESLEVDSADVTADPSTRIDADSTHTSDPDDTHHDTHDPEKASAAVVPVTRGAKTASWTPRSSSSISGPLVLACLCGLLVLALLAANLYYSVDVDRLIRNRLPASSLSTSTTVKCDVAVVGGGPGGVYTAMRLQQSSSSLRVCLFEQLQEVGGRLKTRWFDGAPTSPLDLGGMRFYQRHRLVYSMMQTLGLSSYSPAYSPLNYDWLRGRKVTSTSWAQGTAPYFFTPAEQALLNVSGSTPSTLSQPIMNALGLNKASTATWTACDWNQWEATAVYPPSQALVKDVGYWYALQQLMSDDAVNAMRDAFGYDSTVSETNLADDLHHSLPSVNDSDITSYAELRPTLGYQTLVQTMLTAFKQAGGTVYLNAQLLSSQVAAGGGSLLTFSGSVTSVQAGSTILAMPQGAIQALQSPGLSLSTASAQAALASVTAVPAFKIFLAFPSAWWTPLGFTGGIMRTTLPFRKAYYWNIESNGNGVLLAGYEDSQSTSYLADILENYPPLTPIYFSQQPSMTSAHTLVPLNSSDELAIVARDVMRQIRQAHPDVTVPDPYAAVFQVQPPTSSSPSTSSSSTAGCCCC